MELLQSMNVFARLAELGSFTKVAEALSLGRPQVTHAIQELEALLGIRLFHRTTRRVRLTAEGEIFHQRVTEILSRVADATSLFASPDRKLGGRLRIDLPVALARSAIIGSLRQFNRAHPEISLSLGVSDRRLDLVAEGVDCVVRIGELPDSTLVARRIGTLSMVTCASPGYVDEFGVPEILDELIHHRAVNYVSGSARKIMDWRFQVGTTERTLTLRSGLRVNDSAAFVEAGLAGFGLLQALRISVAEHLASGTLVEVLAAYRPSPRPVSIVYPSKAHLAPQVRAFIEWASEQFPDLLDDDRR